MESFTRDLFAGFDAMRALTYTPSIPMVLRLLRDYDYDDFECIFGHGGVLSRGAADPLALRSVVQARLNQGVRGCPGHPTEDEVCHKGLIRAIYRTFMDSRDKPRRRRVPRRRTPMTVTSPTPVWAKPATNRLGGSAAWPTSATSGPPPTT